MIEGFEVPLHRSLTTRIMLAGAPRTVAIVNGTIAAALGIGLRLWVAGLVFWIVTHTASVYLAKKDPQFMEVMLRHLRFKPHMGA